MVEGGAQIAALAVGAVLSTLLLLLYVPGAVALREAARARKEAAKTLPDEGKEKIAEIDAMITLHGFDTSTTKLVATFAQLLLPLIVTVPLGSVVTLLGS
jgi:hypothetical protein